MVGKKSLTALCCASALLLAGAGSACAADDGIPFEKLVEVTVPTRTTSTASSSTTTPRSTSASRTTAAIMLNVFVTAEEKGELKAAGYTIGATIEDSNTGTIRMERAPGGHRRGGARRRRRRERHAQAAPSSRASRVVPTPGDTVIQRANTFTDVVGPSGGTTTARFLYVEAYNKSTKITGTTTVTGPTLALSYAGADGVYSTRDQHGPLRRHRPDAGRLHVPPAADPPPARASPTSRRSASPPRRPPAARPRASRPSPSPSGSARTSRRTWPGSRTSRSSRTTWTRPRTARTSTRSPPRTRS